MIFDEQANPSPSPTADASSSPPLCRWLRSLGVECALFGPSSRPLGDACVVLNANNDKNDVQFMPLAPSTRCPVVISVGAVRERAVVVRGKVVVRPMLTLTATMESGAAARRLTARLRAVLEDPRRL